MGTGNGLFLNYFIPHPQIKCKGRGYFFAGAKNRNSLNRNHQLGRGKPALWVDSEKKIQSHNFIVDISNCPLAIGELEKQAEDLYRSPRVAFLEQVVFVKDGDIVKAFCRK